MDKRAAKQGGETTESHDSGLAAHVGGQTRRGSGRTRNQQRRNQPGPIHVEAHKHKRGVGGVHDPRGDGANDHDRRHDDVGGQRPPASQADGIFEWAHRASHALRKAGRALRLGTR